MKKSLTFSLVLAGLSIFFLFSCKKEDPKVIPTVTAKSVSSITDATASSGGEVTSEGGVSVTSRGVCWSTNQNPTTEINRTNDGTGPGSFSSSITGLSPGTTYYLRAYAINNIGIGYSAQISFNALAILSVLTTADISNILTTSLSCGGNITSDGGGSITSRGVCWSTSDNPTIADSKTSDGNGTGSFSSSVTGLSPNVVYYFRAYATNSAGTAYGNTITRRTNPIIPTFTTTQVTNHTATSASSGGNIGSDGNATLFYKGVCWSMSHNPMPTGDPETSDVYTGVGSFTGNLTGLSPNSTYYIRAYAQGWVPTGFMFANELSFTTPELPGETVTDIDGNVYHTITIGTQVWMAENLKTTKYRTGDQITHATSSSDWDNAHSGVYRSCDNDDNNVALYGMQYNGYTATDSRNIAPQGWHVPSDAEWTTLTNFLGGLSASGAKLKERGRDHWANGNDGTNETAFTALPDGQGHSMSVWASSTPGTSSPSNWARVLIGSGAAQRLLYANSGYFFIRCVKD